jgi:CysZ protein
MILPVHAFLRALAQLGDPRFRRVLLLGALLALALLVAAYAAFLQLLWWMTPEMVELPLIGPVTGLHSLLGWASFFTMLVFSVFLMVPVALAFSGLFLEDVAQAVEARHYAYLPPARVVSLITGLRQSVNFLGLVLVLNAVALFLYPLAGPFAPLLFWALNGGLLGWEYFTLVAMRRLPKDEVAAMRFRNLFRVWFAGALMSAGLSVPFLNLLVPVLGVATFTHIFHRLSAEGR